MSQYLVIQTASDTPWCVYVMLLYLFNIVDISQWVAYGGENNARNIMFYSQNQMTHKHVTFPVSKAPLTSKDI